MRKRSEQTEELELSLKGFTSNLSCVFKENLYDIVHVGITIYDPFLIDDELRDKKVKENINPVGKTFFYREKSSLDTLLYDSNEKKLVKSSKYSSEINLKSDLMKKSSLSPNRKRKNTHQAWNNKQLIRVYGMRYDRSIRNLQHSFSRSPKRFRVNSLTPTRL